MNTYDNEVFNYLTQPDNYRAAKEISGRIGDIDQKLIRSFWPILTDKVNSLITGTGWVVKFSEEDEWFSIHRPDWQNLGINCDEIYGIPDLGIHAPEEHFDRIKVDAILEHLIKSMGRSAKSTSAWPFYYKLGINFYEPATLESILPTNRAEKIAEVSDKISTFFKNYSGLLNRIEKEARISTAIS